MLRKDVPSKDLIAIKISDNTYMVNQAAYIIKNKEGISRKMMPTYAFYQKSLRQAESQAKAENLIFWGF